jgi:uroporphyrinogen-III synthase
MNFQDARVAVLEARMSDEMAGLIQRNGGTAWSVPAVREASIDAARPVAQFIDQFGTGSIQMVVFFTGVGVNALLREAERLGRQTELLQALREVTVVCRGPKPGAVLKRNAIPIAASAVEPFTTTELLEVLSSFSVSGKNVGVVHYGEKNTVVTDFLVAHGATLQELSLYEWQLPEKTDNLKQLVHELIAGHVDALLFTSQVQVRHLFIIAAEMNKADELADALQHKTVVASIGPTTTGVLATYHITPHVVPEHPKMGHLVKALSQYMSV